MKNHFEPLIGLWKIDEYWMEGANGDVFHLLGKDLDGFLRYTTDNEVYVAYMRRDRAMMPEWLYYRNTDRDRAEASTGYTSYFGRVRATSDRVYHEVVVGLHPNQVGKTLERSYKLEGDILTLSTTPPSIVDGVGYTTHLRWIRTTLM